MKFLVRIVAVMTITLAFAANSFAVEYETYSKRSEYLTFLGRTIPSNLVQCLEVDPEEPNSLYIGTGSGLAKFNGKSFRTFGADPGMFRDAPAGERINAILAATNEIWVATDTGLSKYSKLTSKWFYYLKGSQSQMPADAAQCLLLSDPILYIGTWGEGLAAFNTKDGKWKFYDQKKGLDGRFITSLAYDPVKNVVWIGTLDRGLFSLSGEQIRPYNSKNSDLSSDRVDCLAYSSGKLYIGAASGLTVFDGQKFKNYSKKSGFASNVILSLKASKFDVFVGTASGLYRIYNDSVTSYPLTNHLSGSKPMRIISIACTDKKIYVGTQHFGLIELNR